MAEDSRQDRTRFGVSEIRVMLLLLFGGELVAIGAGVWTHRSAPQLSQLFATAAITLFFGSLLGGVLRLLIADFDRKRIQRAAQREFIERVLSDLKRVNDQVDRGRMLIKAHRSAKTYGEEMRLFIESRVELQNVTRALKTDERGEAILSVRDDVSRMEAYLQGLLEEYQENYREISLDQSFFESRLKRALEASPTTDSAQSAIPENTAWKRLKQLERLTDFLLPISEVDRDGSPNKSNYVQSFLRPLDSATHQLRSQLAAELSSR